MLKLFDTPRDREHRQAVVRQRQQRIKTMRQHDAAFAERVRERYRRERAKQKARVKHMLQREEEARQRFMLQEKQKRQRILDTDNANVAAQKIIAEQAQQNKQQHILQQKRQHRQRMRAKHAQKQLRANQQAQSSESDQRSQWREQANSTARRFRLKLAKKQEQTKRTAVQRGVPPALLAPFKTRHHLGKHAAVGAHGCSTDISRPLRSGRAATTVPIARVQCVTVHGHADVAPRSVAKGDQSSAAQQSQCPERLCGENHLWLPRNTEASAMEIAKDVRVLDAQAAMDKENERALADARARIRGNIALKKEMLEREAEEVTAALEDVSRVDRRRRLDASRMAALKASEMDREKRAAARALERLDKRALRARAAVQQSMQQINSATKGMVEGENDSDHEQRYARMTNATNSVGDFEETAPTEFDKERSTNNSAALVRNHYHPDHTISAATTPMEEDHEVFPQSQLRGSPAHLVNELQARVQPSAAAVEESYQDTLAEFERVGYLGSKHRDSRFQTDDVVITGGNDTDENNSSFMDAERVRSEAQRRRGSVASGHVDGPATTPGNWIKAAPSAEPKPLFWAVPREILKEHQNACFAQKESTNTNGEMDKSGRVERQRAKKAREHLSTAAKNVDKMSHHRPRVLGTVEEACMIDLETQRCLQSLDRAFESMEAFVIEDPEGEEQAEPEGDAGGHMNSHSGARVSEAMIAKGADFASISEGDSMATDDTADSEGIIPEMWEDITEDESSPAKPQDHSGNAEGDCVSMSPVVGDVNRLRSMVRGLTLSLIGSQKAVYRSTMTNTTAEPGDPAAEKQLPMPTVQKRAFHERKHGRNDIIPILTDALALFRSTQKRRVRNAQEISPMNSMSASSFSSPASKVSLASMSPSTNVGSSVLSSVESPFSAGSGNFALTAETTMSVSSVSSTSGSSSVNVNHSRRPRSIFRGEEHQAPRRVRVASATRRVSRRQQHLRASPVLEGDTDDSLRPGKNPTCRKAAAAAADGYVSDVLRSPVTSSVGEVSPPSLSSPDTDQSGGDGVVVGDAKISDGVRRQAALALRDEQRRVSEALSAGRSVKADKVSLAEKAHAAVGRVPPPRSRMTSASAKKHNPDYTRHLSTTISQILKQTHSVSGSRGKAPWRDGDGEGAAASVTTIPVAGKKQRLAETYRNRAKSWDALRRAKQKRRAVLRKERGWK